MAEKRYAGSLDQGTTSTRFILFDHDGQIAASHQLEHKQIYPKPGWVEHDALEIWERSQEVIRETLKKVGATAEDISGIGITNQRETVVAWDPHTGVPYHNAIVWQDLRGKELIDSLTESGKAEAIQKRSGVPLSPYFAGSKISWLLDNVSGLKEKAESGELLLGTIDSWLAWNLTGGKDGGVHITDASNASRYLLMDIETLSWDDGLLETFGVPRQALPEIVPSTGRVYGMTSATGPFGGEIPVCGILGDQQAALYGQACFAKGMGKNTYGTGCFMLVNIGEELCHSTQGLLTTVAYLEEGKRPVYALEGSVAVAGSLVQWTRDNLGLVDSAPAIDVLAETVEDNGGVYFVPAFAGLYAPYWRSDARGVICGLTGYATSAHIARAVLEATAFQANDIFHAMEADSGIRITELKVDGGLINSRPLMQFQADILDIPVIRPAVAETTALGSAYAAGLTTGFWKDTDELSSQWKEKRRWVPDMDAGMREEKIRFWHKAVERTLDWAD